MARALRKIAGVRLGIAVQVFTTLLILAVGYFVIERNLRELTLSPRPVSPYQIKMVLLNIRSEVLAVALVAFLSGLALTLTIRRELKSAVEQVRRISDGIVSPALPGDLSQEFVPLNTAIRELAESVGRFLRSSVTDAIILFGEDLIIRSLNNKAELLLGYRSQEVTGKSLGLIFPEHAENKELYAWIRKGKGEEISSRPSFGAVLTKSGEWIPVRLGVFQLGVEQDHLRGIVAGVFDEGEWERIHSEFQRAERLSNLGLLVSGLAHEIKNPLGSIKGLVQLLEEEFPPGHQKRKYLETVLEEVARLDNIMKRLLDVSSPTRWQRQLVDLVALFKEVGTLMEGEASTRGIALEVGGLDKELFTLGDPERLRQALINVMKNGLEATARGGCVRYGAKKEFPWCVIWVENEVSEPFSPGSAKELNLASQGKVKGSGLGLLITQQILQYHGGRLEMEAPSEGRVLVKMKFPTQPTHSPALQGGLEPSGENTGEKAQP
jgi:two-component system sensor histidine kinase HydH